MDTRLWTKWACVLALAVAGCSELVVERPETRPLVRVGAARQGVSLEEFAKDSKTLEEMGRVPCVVWRGQTVGSSRKDVFRDHRARWETNKAI